MQITTLPKMHTLLVLGLVVASCLADDDNTLWPVPVMMPGYGGTYSTYEVDGGYPRGDLIRCYRIIPGGGAMKLFERRVIKGLDGGAEKVLKKVPE